MHTTAYSVVDWGATGLAVGIPVLVRELTPMS